MSFRSSMTKELEAAECLDGAHAIWSMWPGYLQNTSGQLLRKWFYQHGIPMVVHHASGHACIPDLQRLVAALAPARVIPIHSAACDRFPEYFPRVEPHADGKWWEV